MDLSFLSKMMGGEVHRPGLQRDAIEPVKMSGKKLQICLDLIKLLLMKIKLYHPTREVSFQGPKPVSSILMKLGLPREAHLVIYNDVLVTEDTMIPDDGVIEIRPVISGGSR